MRIILVDDHPLLRQALALTVVAADPAASVEQCATLAEALELIASGPAPDLLLLDLHLADSNGISGLIEASTRYPELRTAIVSGQEDPETIQAARASGAAGFIPKSASRPMLIAAITALMAGHAWFPDAGEPSGHSTWSAMQVRVIDCLKRGLMNKQMAHELGMSEHTVKYHLAAIFRKARCHSRSQLLSALADNSIRF